MGVKRRKGLRKLWSYWTENKKVILSFQRIKFNTKSNSLWVVLQTYSHHLEALFLWKHPQRHWIYSRSLILLEGYRDEKWFRPLVFYNIIELFEENFVEKVTVSFRTSFIFGIKNIIEVKLNSWIKTLLKLFYNAFPIAHFCFTINYSMSWSLT